MTPCRIQHENILSINNKDHDIFKHLSILTVLKYQQILNIVSFSIATDDVKFEEEQKLGSQLASQIKANH